MVAIVTGTGLGLDRSSEKVLGKVGLDGQVGDATFGRYGDKVYVNGANGNLMVERTDEVLIGQGLNDVISRGYNSESGNAGYQSFHSWQFGDSRSVVNLTGSVNTAGSTVTLIDWDGSDLLYTYDANAFGSNQGGYVCHQGGLAADRLTFQGTTWTWTGGHTHETETFDSSNGGRLSGSTDSDGNQLSYTYDAGNGHLLSVQTQDGETTSFSWSSGKLTQVVTTKSDGTTLSTTSYGYDSSKRLTTVTVDLTPYDNSTTDGNTVVTTYAYDGTSDRISSISQTGGARLDVTYDTSNRVQTLTQTIATGVTRTTTLTYTNNTKTTITDNAGQNTVLTFDGSGQLTSLKLPPAQTGTAAQTLLYSYDPDGDVSTSQDATGDLTTYRYDGNDNLLVQTNPLGDTITRTYDPANNLLTVTNGNGETTRFAYDAENHLRFVVTPDGEVTEYQYKPNGSRKAAIVYRDQTYTGAITETAISGWLASQPDLSTAERTDYVYDFRGNLSQAKTYTADNADGTGTNASLTTITYTYDQFGQLLTKQTSGVANSEVYLLANGLPAYDGLGRLTASVDLNSGQTNIAWNDAQNTCTVTYANQFVETSTYNKAGELTSYSKSDSYLPTATATYQYDSMGRLCVVSDGTTAPDGTLRKSYYLYDNVGRKVADVAADGSMTEYKYDADNRLVATVAYATKLTSSQMGALLSNGNPTDPTLSSVRPGADSNNDVWSWRIYDTDNRLLETIDGQGGATVLAYDSAGNLTSTTSYANKLSSVGTFQSTIPTTVQIPLADAVHDDTTVNFYDNENRLIGKLDGNGYLSEIVYNQAGEKTETIGYDTQITSANRTTWSFSRLKSTAGTSTQDIHQRYFYDDAGQLQYALDPNLRPTEYQYDAAGHVVSKTEYSGSIHSTQNPYTLSYVQQQIISRGLATSADNRQSWMVYDANTGNLAFSIDAAGGVTQYKYDSTDMGRVVSETQFATTWSSASAPTQTSMNQWASSSSNISSDDRTTRMVYDLQGRLVYSVDAESYVTEYRYDQAGRTTLKIQYAAQYSVNDSVSQASLRTQLPNTIPSTAVQTAYSYDADGRLSDTIQDAGGLAIDTRLLYDGIGRLTDKIVANGTTDAATTHYDYYSNNLLHVETRAYGTDEQAATTYTYDGMGNVLTRKDPRHDTSTYTYDALGHVLTATVPIDSSTNAVTTNTYDAFGNLSTRQDANGNTTYFYYDLLNRLTLQVDATSYATATSYTIGNAVASVTRYWTVVAGPIIPGVQPTVTHVPSLDATTTFGRDKLDRLTSVTDAEGHSEVYGLNAFGDRLTVTNKLGGVTTNTFDHRGLLVSEVLPMTARTADNALEASTVTNTYVYDARGNLTQKVEASSLAEQRTTNYTYDKLDRLKTTAGDAVQIVTTNLNVAPTTVTPTTTFIYDARGDLIETDDANGARTLSYYDHLGRKTYQVDALGTLSAWTYDNNGNVQTARVYGDFISLPSTPGGLPPTPPTNYRETAYNYDESNRLVSASVTAQVTGEYNTATSTYSTTTQDLTTTYAYDAMGNVTQQTDDRGNSVYTWYNKVGQKVAQLDQNNYLTTWTLDFNGNVTTERRAALAYTGTIGSNPPTVASNAADRITNFTYDKNGRRLTETRTGVAYATVSTTNGALTPHTGDSTVTYTYNEMGEVLTKTEATGDKTSYAYDTLGRQTSITSAPFYSDSSGTVQTYVSYVYDGLNNLVREGVENNGVTPWRITRYYFGAGSRLSYSLDATNFRKDYAYDAAGNIMAVTYTRLKSDASSVTEAQTTQYDKLGRVTQQSIASCDANGHWTWGDKAQTQYDAYGEVSARGVNVTNNNWQQTYSYDGAGRLWRATADDGTVKLYVYDGAGNRTLEIDSDGNSLGGGQSLASLSSISDAIALLTANGHTIGSQDVQGMLATATVRDARGQDIETIAFRREYYAGTTDTIADMTTSRTYNAFGEVTEEMSPGAHPTDYVYNTMGKVVQEIQPLVATYDETGTLTNRRPTQTNSYDISGRLVAVQDANLNVNTRVLLAGTGYDGSDAMVTDEFHADGGHVINTYDAFGELTQSQNEVGKTESYTYDKMGRVLSQTHQARTDGTQLIDHYTYDGLGQRLTHWNSQLGLGVKDTTDYDSQGRVVKMVDMGGNTTTYSYTWSSSAATNGLGTFGGWIKTTTNAANKTETETDDLFGHTVAKTDFGGHDFTYSYDLAGQLTSRHDDYGDGVSGYIHYSGETVTYSYFNTGLTASVDTAYSGAVYYNDPNGGGLWERTSDDLTATYHYDVYGNRILENTDHNVDLGVDFGGQQPTVHEETATAAYNTAGTRITSLTETVDGDTATMSWKYDANGNVRNRHSTYYTLDSAGNVTATKATQDDWYTYDSMNRFLVTRGALITNADGTKSITSTGTNYGVTLTYDAAGERKTAVNGSDGTRESYTYTADGYLSQVNVGTGTGVERASYTRDAMGRVTDYDEYDSTGTNVVYEKQSWYDNKSQVTKDEVTAVRTDGTWFTETQYAYTDGASWNGSAWTGGTTYEDGNATSEYSVTDKNGAWYSTATTTNSYGWWDGAEQSYTAVSTVYSGNTTNYSTSYSYDKRNFLTQASISDGSPRTIAYTENADGSILENNESASASPATKFFWFDGIQQGDVSNNGTSDVDYVTSIARHTAVPSTGFFTNGSTSPTAYADFDASYQPINGLDGQDTASRYTVQDGDTLQSIAQQIWGDSNFWYLIADANGLNGSSQLVTGMDLIIPNKVANVANSNSTYRVYDPNLYIGDTSPTHPPKPHNNHNCGVMGEVMLAVIAIAVTIALPELAPGLFGAMGPVLGGAVAGAAGSLVSQGVGLATGIQSKFDWGGLAMGAIGGAVGGALGPGGIAGSSGAFSGVSDSAFIQGALRGAAASLVTQGIGVATGLQSKFDWAGVAAAGIGGGVIAEASADLPGAAVGTPGQMGSHAATPGNLFVSGMAGAIANAATRTLITGTDFGDNIIRALPNVIGQTIGNAIAGAIEEQQQQQAMTGGSGPNIVLASDAVYDNGVPVGALGAGESSQQQSAGHDLWNDLMNVGADIVGGVESLFSGAQAQPQAAADPNGAETVVVTDQRGGFWQTLGSDLSNVGSDIVSQLGDPHLLLSALADTGRGAVNGLEDVIEAGVNLLSGAVPGGSDYVPFMHDLRLSYDTPLFGGIIETAASLGIVRELGAIGSAEKVVSEEPAGNQVYSTEETNRAEPLSPFQNADGTLINADQAVMDESKFTDYALDPNNPKSVVFKSALGYDQSNAADLMNQIDDVLPDTPATFNRMTDYGPRYQADLPITGANGNLATVTTIWQYDLGSTVPRLITLWVK